MQRALLDPGELVGEPRDGAHERDRRRPDALGLGARGDVSERRDHRALARQRAAFDHRRRLVLRATGADQPPRDLAQLFHAHVEDERSREAPERVPVERALVLLRILVTRDERDRGRLGAVGHRDARVGGRRDAGRHTRDDLERDAGGGQRLSLLAAAPEHEGVAALQAHDTAALARE